MANNQKFYSITKWRKNSKGTGVLVQLTHYDSDTKTFSNVKAHVNLASNYAGKDASEMPATTAKIDKEGRLWLCCTRHDDYTPTEKKPQSVDTEDDIPF